jgi:hypothetical protein
VEGYAAIHDIATEEIGSLAGNLGIVSPFDFSRPVAQVRRGIISGCPGVGGITRFAQPDARSPVPAPGAPSSVAAPPGLRRADTIGDETLCNTKAFISFRASGRPRGEARALRWGETA